MDKMGKVLSVGVQRVGEGKLHMALGMKKYPDDYVRPAVRDTPSCIEEVFTALGLGGATMSALKTVIRITTKDSQIET